MYAVKLEQIDLGGDVKALFFFLCLYQFEESSELFLPV